MLALPRKPALRLAVLAVLKGFDFLAVPSYVFLGYVPSGACLVAIGTLLSDMTQESPGSDTKLISRLPKHNRCKTCASRVKH